MSGKRIKGITIEIDGSTTGLDKALKGVDSSLSSTQSSLKDVNRLLKLDPTNTELLQQKQKLLSSAVDDTSKRLESLKKASEDAAKSADKYDAWKAAYDPIQEEIKQTKERAKELQEQMASMKEIGEIDTDAYKSLQQELKETNSKLKDLQKQAKDVSDEFENPINPAQYDSLQREIIETEQKLKSLESESEATSSALKNDFEDAAEGAYKLKDSIDDVGDTIKSGIFMEAAEQISGIGDKISGLKDSAIDSFNDVNNASAKASAYFGETGKAAEDTAEVIKDVYEGGVGDSMNSVSDAVIAVKKNLEGLDQVTLTNITNQAITLDETYGIDMNETLRGVNSLMENFGMTAQEAMDYVVAGTQNGLDKTNELGDNLSEYSGKFSQAGYSAQEYFQLLNNGLDGGAYNLDKVNDAINEVTTRLADGTIGDNIGMYSDKTQELFKKWQDGGATQKEVIDSIVSDIAGTTNQQEALNKAAQAFGTMAEDGNLKFITSLTSVGDSYDDVSGKAQGMFDATTTPAQEMEANMRKLKDSLAPLGEKLSEIANDILPPLVSAITTVAQAFADLPAPVQGILIALAGLIAGIAKIAPLITALKALGLPAALSSIGTAITGTVLPAIGSGIAAFASFLVPILPIIAAIGGVIAVGVLLYKNWDTVKEHLGAALDAIKMSFEIAWDAIKNTVSIVTGVIKSVITNVFNAVKGFIGSVLNTIKGIVNSVFNAIKTTVTSVMNGIKSVISSVWNAVKGFVSSVVNAIKGVVSSVFNTIKTTVTSIMNGIKSVISSVWNAIKGVVTSIVNAIKSVVSSAFNAVKTAVSGVMNGIKSVVSGVWNSVKSTVSSSVANIKNSISNGFNGAKNTVSSIFNNIKSTISDKINVAKDTVKSAIDKIKGFFNFSWSLPKLKMPHPKISGEFSLNPPSVPKFSIDWYKKAMDSAMVMDGPTAFGYDAKTNQLLAGGEAGREVVSGEEHLIDLIGKVVHGQYDQLARQLDLLNSVVQQYFPQVVQNMDMDIVLDDGALVGRLASKMDVNLGRVMSHKERGN
ncbi:MAG: phage tail tape measure protein [Lachnospiraceae bacterium]|nr:phage tail tape measure protein [Lachnospiraceae bacterium]